MIPLIVILLLLAIILYLPICIEVRYLSGRLAYRVSYAGITLYSNTAKRGRAKQSKPKKGVKAKGSKQRKGKKSKAKGTKKGKGKRVDVLDAIGMVLDILKAIKTDIGKFITSIKVTDLYVDFQVADLDACDCALKFGKVSAVLGNVLGFLQWNFVVKKKSISVVPKYNSDESRYDISFKVKLGVGRGLGRILVILFRVVPILIRRLT